ncbi:MAG: hypothetical protein AB1757_23225 [Acidobacteriota bacterium]
MNHQDSTADFKAKLKARIVPVTELTLAHKVRMFELMQKYYDGVSREQFLHDLMKKDAVILLYDERQKQIQGFSTLMKVTVNQQGKIWQGIFSGDTVIEKSFWGQRALGKAFLGYLFKEKLRNPFVPLYWLLITKGYKTYLMMANNFSQYYPRFDVEMPADKKALMDAFYSLLYPNGYDAQTGLIYPENNGGQLKSGVANISPLLMEANPKIAFFQSKNPQWTHGVELACLARMTVWMPFQYALKAFTVDCLLKPLGKIFGFKKSKVLRSDG